MTGAACRRGRAAIAGFALMLLGLWPASVHAAQPVQLCEADWHDPARAGRVVPVRIRMPAGAARLPVILFSHGLGGTLDDGTDWVEAWAAAGFMTVNLQHAGSDAAIRDGTLRTLARAMNAGELQARADDVHFVIDRITRGGDVGGCDLGRADLTEIGMSGHSFGAQTTLAVSGGVYAATAAMRDRRIQAAIAFSPQPAPGQDDQAAFGAITIPFLSITGTRDSFAQYNGVTMEDRTRPYQAMPPGQKYLLIVDGANHAMLGGQTRPSPRLTPTPMMVDAVTQATTLFWQATLKHDAAASARLATLGAWLPLVDRFARK